MTSGDPWAVAAQTLAQVRPRAGIHIHLVQLDA